MTTKKPPRPNWCMNYQVLLNGSSVGTITISHQWSAGGIPRFTATLGDGRSFTASVPGFAMQLALRAIVPGKQVWLWYPGCDTKGLRLRAEGKAPWEPVLEEQEVAHG